MNNIKIFMYSMILIIFSTQVHSAKINPMKQLGAFTVFGTGIGKSGFSLADTNNDGDKEIIAGGSTFTFGNNNYWYVIDYNKKTNSYEIIWTSEFSNNYSDSYTQITTDEKNKVILIGHYNGIIEVYEQKGPKKITEFKATLWEPINKILVSDIDNDGEDEWSILTTSNIYIYSPDNYSKKNQFSYGGTDFAVGDVDGDGRNETITTDGYVLEINSTSATIEWNNSINKFGYRLKLSDIDNDGIKEVIAASKWYNLNIFDVDSKSVKWNIRTSNDIDSLTIADVTGDNSPNILYADGQGGAIHILNASDGVELSKIYNPNHGVTNVLVTDSDNDGQQEIIWGAGYSSTGEDHLYFYNSNTLKQEFSTQQIDGPFTAIHEGDLNNDGNIELVAISNSSNDRYESGILTVMNAETHQVKYISPSSPFHTKYGGTRNINAVKIGDLNNDGKNEIVVAADTAGSYGAIYVLNGITYLLESLFKFDTGSPLYALSLADVDNDGSIEIVAVGSQKNSSSPGTFLYIIDGITGSVKWKSRSLVRGNTYPHNIEIADLDRDGILEIIISIGKIYIFNGLTHTKWESLNTGFYAVEVADINNNGTMDILAGTRLGEIISFNGRSHARTTIAKVCNSSILGLRANRSRKYKNQIQFSCGDKIGKFDLENKNIIEESSNIGITAGDKNSLRVYNVNGKARIAIGTNNGIRIYK